ncbi:MAG: threonylcarbamoyl-AMP synthase [Verrucomicrobia bacterium]|nr:threonylcarbamoyl-AMP synthase [Verrucomicrobiota bacterium]
MTALPEVLEIHTPALFAAAVARAAARLRAGDLVALPTETVYGLAANALDPAAVARIFEAKERPAHNPIIVHVADVAMARACAAAWPPMAARLAAAFWPGPLTLVLPKATVIPGIVTAGGDTVGLRWPSHPFMQAVIRECGFPLAAPSANRANQLSPTRVGHVLASLSDRVKLIVDGGPCQVGIESTVLDLAYQPPRILRPGMIHAASLEAVMGVSLGSQFAQADSADEGMTRWPLRSPGQLPRHYAPRARLRLVTWATDAELHAVLNRLGVEKATTWVVAHSHIPNDDGFAGVSVVPRDAEAFARALYAELHRCDAEGAATIVVETPPAGPEWQGIADRLHRAAAP